MPGQAAVGGVPRACTFAASQGIAVFDIGKYQVIALHQPRTDGAVARGDGEGRQAVAAGADPPQLHAGPGGARGGAQDEDV